MKAIEAYRKLKQNRERPDPKIIVAHTGSKELTYCEKLAQKGFAVLRKVNKHPKKILSYRMYEITHTENQIETADYRLR
jgi:CheY-like chemotaxis protein